eukprot:GHVL01004380.1.p1 GENE.GHVL01004380.1~~GHVL01004380.1.p1  ORF type:complete len:124 (-),score=7.98 GHVL01004380.1:354-725(-)
MERSMCSSTNVKTRHSIDSVNPSLLEQEVFNSLAFPPPPLPPPPIPILRLSRVVLKVCFCYTGHTDLVNRCLELSPESPSRRLCKVSLPKIQCQLFVRPASCSNFEKSTSPIDALQRRRRTKE